MTDTNVYSITFKPIYDSVSRLFEQNRIDQGLHYLDSATRHISQLTVADKFRIYGFHYVANNKIKHDNKTALLYADSMLSVLEKQPNRQSYLPYYAEASFAKGDALFELGKYTDAFNSYYQGYLTGKNDFNNCTLSDYTYRMGMITYKQGNFKSSASYFKESFDQCASCKEEFTTFFRQQEVLDNIALCYRNYGQLDSSVVYFNKALRYLDQYGKKYNRAGIIEVAKAVIYGNMADVLNLRGKRLQAAQMLERSIATNLKKGNDFHDAQLSEVKLGQIYMALNEPDKVKILLDTLRVQLDSMRSSDVEAGWNLLMGTYYKNKKDFASAIPYVERFHHIKDSLAETTRILKENNVNEQIGGLEKQYQIISLRNRQKIILWGSLVFACMASVIIMLIYRNWKRSNKEMRIVNTLNTQVNQQKADLERTLNDLKKSSQEKDRILRTVAHDLRNPLGGIASLTSSMIEDTDYNNEQIELLKIIKETAFDSLELINEILDATNTAESELHKQLVDINTLLSNSVELLRFKAAEKNQQIVLNQLQSPEELMISREKIWRVISNLISNAIKFSPVGAMIQVDVLKEDDDILISVNDHGIGIPEENKNKVFNMFTDAKRPGTLGEKSFGLGLSICRQIIERHNGSIWFESTPGSGTTFYVRLSKSNLLKAEPVHIDS